MASVYLNFRAMSRTCPNCGVSIGRVAGRYKRRPDLRWYQYSATQFFCRECKAQIRPVVRPLGWGITGLMVILVAAGIFSDVIETSTQLRQPSEGILIGVAVVIFLLLGICLKKWGIAFSVSQKS